MTDDMVRPWPSEAEQVRSVAFRWHRQYQHSFSNNRTNREVYDALLALPATATAADVAAIIGNDSWVGKLCTLCNEYHMSGFEIGEPDDCESRTVQACTECAKRIARTILTHHHRLVTLRRPDGPTATSRAHRLRVFWRVTMSSRCLRSAFVVILAEAGIVVLLVGLFG